VRQFGDADFCPALLMKPHNFLPQSERVLWLEIAHEFLKFGAPPKEETFAHRFHRRVRQRMPGDVLDHAR